ncbi:MAG: hypothetical protein MR384_13405 [Lachnospiraceae bacterium]|nr:hypothetical protein [Lachnospiraceae bacterium]
MKKAWSDVKSFVTVLMTIAMVILLFAPIEVNKEVLTIFSATYGSVMTYFFTKKKTDEPDSDDISDNTQG